jgi:D-glycero-alpha-D-manno-heptose-7-phosphate kinase
MIISKTPLRISFFGGGTDLPSFYMSCDYGSVLSTSINSYIYVTVKKHTELFAEKYRLQYSETELGEDFSKIKNPIIRECLRYLGITENIYISTIADAPGSSGLGSSSSFCVGLLLALYKYKGEDVSTARLAKEAAHIEIDILKRPMGKQDSYAAAFGGLNYFRFNDDQTVLIKPVSISEENKKLLFDNMLSFWTGVARPSESILDEQNRNHKKNQSILKKIRAQADIISDHFLSGDFSIESLGELLHEGWVLKKQLSSNVTTSKIDHLYDIALENGAIGGKLSGAGSGGFLNIIATKDKHSKIIEKMNEAGLILYEFNEAPNGAQVMVAYS